MIPVLTVDEMREVDGTAPEPLDVLVDRAGAAVARAALRMMGGGYGRRVIVVVGRGNNGADGRVAARRLARRGVRVQVTDAETAPARLPVADLVIDAAFGTGFRGEYRAPDPGDAPVLAVDIPSGVHGDTGEADESAVMADATVTFAALKPGLLLGEGRARAGTIEVVDIGLDTTSATIHLVEDDDIARSLPARAADAHKWHSAVFVLAGSPGMTGAATLAARAALRAGAGLVRLGTPGVDIAQLVTGEIVAVPLPATGWAGPVLEPMRRTKVLVIGPGLGRSDATQQDIRTVLEEWDQPAVVDADGMYALGDVESAAAAIAKRKSATVFTPHEGEFERLTGSMPGVDRIGATRRAAASTGAVVLLKGSTTVVADPDGRVLVAATGGTQLATAGSGDVLSGMIGAFLAQGLEPVEAAAYAAHAHGAAAQWGWSRGLIAGDLLDLVPAWVSDVTDART